MAMVMAKAALLEQLEISSSAEIIFLTRATVFGISWLSLTSGRGEGLTREGDCASDLCRRCDGSIVVRHLYRANVSDMKDGKSEDEDG